MPNGQPELGGPLVHIVDDEQSVRTSLSRLLRTSNYRTWEFSTASAFLENAEVEIAGCVLVDLRMPDTTGLELIEVLERRGSPFGVILMTGWGEIEDSVNAMKLGAVDFLTKPLDQNQILDRVEAALVMSHARHLANSERARLDERFATLTPRERQVCELVSRGLLNKQIAMQLGASEKTVKIHRGRVMTKLEVHSVPELVRLVDRVLPARAS